MRCFLVPRGVAIIAGGSAAPDARVLTLAADLGSPTYGICSNRFLDREFQTVDLFHHRDKNVLRRIDVA